MPLCAGCGTDNPDRARFCLECGATFSRPAPPDDERKPVTALFVDVVDSTGRAEKLDPEEVLTLLEPFYALARGALERHGGTVEKFIGDAVVGLFGAPFGHEDDPERAVRAGLAILSAVAALNAEEPGRDLHVRVGVNTGEAIISPGARPAKGQGMAWGDVVNTAARLQTAAGVDEMLVGEQTYQISRKAVIYEPVPPVTVRGKAEPLAAWRARGLREAGEPARTDLPLVGRAADLARLSSAWQRVCDTRRPELVTVSGEPGIGKTRLLWELTGRVGDAAVCWGRCLPYGAGITYWPVIEIFRTAAVVLASDPPEVVSDKLAAFLVTLPGSDTDELRTISAALANLLGAGQTPGGYRSSAIARSELHWGVRRALQLMAAKAPLLVCFEDLHWADPTLVDLVGSLAEPGVDAALLLVAATRPDAVDGRPLSLPGERIELGQLDATDSAQLTDRLLTAHEVSASDSARAEVLRVAGGNPLYLEETVRLLAEKPRVGEVAGPAEPAGLLPSTLRALIGSRLDVLPPEEKAVAGRASVVGGVFWSGAVGHLLGDLAVVPERLALLERREFVLRRPETSIAGEVEWRFRHLIVRDVAYERIPKSRRAQLHFSCANWIESVAGGDELVEIVAYHLEQACSFAVNGLVGGGASPVDRAVEALLRAAARAERREGLPEAARFCSRAIAVIGDARSPQLLDARLRRARMNIALGDLAAAQPELLEVAVAAETEGRLDLRCAALVALGNVAQKQGLASQARSWLTEAARLATEVGDPVLCVRANFELAEVRSDFDADPAEGVAMLREGVALAEVIGDAVLRTEGHLRLGVAQFNHGDLAGSAAELAQCAALASESGSHRDQARATTLLALVTYYRGDIEQARWLARRAADWLARLGDSYFRLQNLRSLALFELAEDDPVAAEAYLREALSLAQATGGWIVTDLCRYLVEALLLQGRPGEAEEHARLAEASTPGQDSYARAASLVARGLMRAAQDPGRSSPPTQFEAAISLLADRGHDLDLAETRLTYARVLRRRGDLMAAGCQLDELSVVLDRTRADQLRELAVAERAALAEAEA